MTDELPLDPLPADERPLDAAALRAIARSGRGRAGCPGCASLVCPGWESLPPGFDEQRLRRLGPLRDPAREPTWDECHPAGTRLWSPDAPIAPGFHPYDQCDVAACTDCGRAFLRYTEFGGYCVERRIRAGDEALIVG